jgi:hypothetical protein
MSSIKGRVVNSWNFPEGRLMKTVAARLHDQGLRGGALKKEFERLFPHWKSYFDKPISTNAISQRADKARRYASENPETHPLMRVYWRPAGGIVRRRARLGKREMARLAKREDRKTKVA